MTLPGNRPHQPRLYIHVLGTVLKSEVFVFYLPVNDALDDILDESGDEEEQDAIVTQVLDEIGIEISGKVRHCTAVFLYLGNLISTTEYRHLIDDKALIAHRPV